MEKFATLPEGQVEPKEHALGASFVDNLGSSRLPAGQTSSQVREVEFPATPRGSPAMLQLGEQNVSGVLVLVKSVKNSSDGHWNLQMREVACGAIPRGHDCRQLPDAGSKTCPRSQAGRQTLAAASEIEPASQAGTQTEFCITATALLLMP
jgi:hypothetical protein